MAKFVPRANNSWSYVLGRFSNSILENFLTDFSETIKARKLKVRINMDSDRMYSVYQNKGQGSITLELCPLVVTLGVIF